MKKIIKLIIILVFTVSIIASWVITFQKTALAYIPPGELQWKAQTCHDGSSYEVCFFSGDLGTCSPWGATRNGDCF